MKECTRKKESIILLVGMQRFTMRINPLIPCQPEVSFWFGVWGIRLLASEMGWDLGLGIRFQGTGVAGSGIWCRA